MASLMSASGGALYHLAALRHRHSLWSDFLREVERWLEHEWNPPEPELILFGASGGWTLPDPFLSRFERVIAVDPDPMAKWIFRRRFSSLAHLEWRANAEPLKAWSDRSDTSALLHGLGEAPRAAILFSNVLGQIPLESRTRRHGSHEKFFAALHGRNWASYHDWLSSAQSPKLTSASREGANLGTFAPGEVKALASRVFDTRATVIDHDTAWLAQGREAETALWRITPRQSHAIAFVKS